MTLMLALALLAAPDPNLLPGKPQLLVGHTDTVASLAFSPDGKQLATGGFDKTARLWDLATGKQLASLSVKGAVSALAFSPDGKLLAIGDLAYGVAVASTAPKGTTLPLLSSWLHPDGVAALAFSPNGKDLMVGGVTATGELYAADSGQRKAEFRARSVVWSRDGKTLLTTTIGEKVALWDVATAKPRTEVAVKSGERLASSDDLKVVAAYGGKGRDVRLLDAALKESATLSPPGPGKGVSSVAISRDGKLMVSTGDDRMLRVWSCAAPTKPEALGALPLEHVGFVVLSPDATRVAVGDGSLVKVYELVKLEVKP